MDRREEAGEIEDNFGERFEQNSLEWYKVLGIMFSCRNVRRTAPAKGNIFQSNTSLQWNNIIFTSSGCRNAEMYKNPQATLLKIAAIRQDGRWQHYSMKKYNSCGYLRQSTLLLLCCRRPPIFTRRCILHLMPFYPKGKLFPWTSKIQQRGRLK